jgi:hypothetical protein
MDSSPRGNDAKPPATFHNVRSARAPSRGRSRGTAKEFRRADFCPSYNTQGSHGLMPRNGFIARIVKDSARIVSHIHHFFLKSRAAFQAVAPISGPVVPSK